MSEISDLIFENMKDIIKKQIDSNCEIYDNDIFKKIKHYEKDTLVGLAIYYDFGNIRYLTECHYRSKNKYLFLKDWRKVFRKNKIMRLRVQIINKKVLNFYKKRGFKIINKDSDNFYMEYRRI